MPKWLTGVVPGCVAAVIAALVSLPLESPDDVVLNTFTVALGCLAAGVTAGVSWAWCDGRPRAGLLHAGIGIAVFAAAVAGAFAGLALLEGMPEFVIPLAAIGVGVSWVLTPIVARLEAPRAWQYGGTAAAFVAAAAVGVGLAGIGDEESGRLELPELAAGGSVVRAEDVQGVTFRVAPGESKLTYTVREKLASLPAESDAVGSTSELSGEVHLDGRPSIIQADMSTLASNQGRRDNFVRQNIFNTDPVVTFEVNGDLGPLPEEYTPGEVITGRLEGTATVRGVTRPLMFEIEAQMSAAGTLQVVGRVDFTWDDFEIPPPNIGGIVQVQDNVHIEVLIVARRDSAG